MFTFSMDEQIGRTLNHRRKLIGLTQVELAQKIGVGFQQVYKYECGTNRISAATLWLMAQALDVRPDYFFGGMEPDERNRAGESELETLVGSVQALPPSIQHNLVALARSMAVDSSKQVRTTQVRPQPAPRSPAQTHVIA